MASLGNGANFLLHASIWGGKSEKENLAARQSIDKTHLAALSSPCLLPKEPRLKGSSGGSRQHLQTELVVVQGREEPKKGGTFSSSRPRSNQASESGDRTIVCVVRRPFSFLLPFFPDPPCHPPEMINGRGASASRCGQISAPSCRPEGVDKWPDLAAPPSAVTITFYFFAPGKKEEGGRGSGLSSLLFWSR